MRTPQGVGSWRQQVGPHPGGTLGGVLCMQAGVEFSSVPNIFINDLEVGCKQNIN